MKYTPLHCHSHFSTLDGLSQPSQMADRCNAIGATSCAVTDHGSISGHVAFHSTMTKKGIKPILGVEAYVCKDHPEQRCAENRKLTHQVILAKNKKGWHDLISLVSESNRPDYYYHNPRLSLETMAPFCGNLISFSGHIGSVLANEVMNRDNPEGELRPDPDWFNKGCRLAEQMEEIFGRGNFFIEVQLIDSLTHKKFGTLGGMMRKIAQVTGIPAIATPDAHYATKDQVEDHRVILCSSLRRSLDEIARLKKADKKVPLGGFFDSDNYHIPSYEEMLKFHTGEELDNTNLIASLCEEYKISSNPILPRYKTPQGQSPNEYIKQLLREGWREHLPHLKRGSADHRKYTERIQMEMDVIHGAGLDSYFLIVRDILDYVKKEGYIVGPGRGSAAGCLISYLLGITQIDPIPYNLLFSRFYNSGRNTAENISMPDIDVDVPKAARQKVIQYLTDKYGQDNVAQIITFQTMKGRGALKEVFRANGVSFTESNAITKFIVDEAKIADELQEMGDDASIIRWALENNQKDLKEWCYIEDEATFKLGGRMAPLFEQAIRLEGTKTNKSKHAAGIVLAGDGLGDKCPMVYDTKEKKMICGFEGPDAEKVGLVKYDILGIRMLDAIMGISSVQRYGRVIEV